MLDQDLPTTCSRHSLAANGPNTGCARPEHLAFKKCPCEGGNQAPQQRQWQWPNRIVKPTFLRNEPRPASKEVRRLPTGARIDGHQAQVSMHEDTATPMTRQNAIDGWSRNLLGGKQRGIFRFGFGLDRSDDRVTWAVAWIPS